MFPVIFDGLFICLSVSCRQRLFQGTIVEWTVQVGQAVQEEDVVALIETDKVTVDIKATMAGVLTKQFGAV